MKYVATVQDNIIVAKGINYTDYVAENEIELTEEEYNTIPIPCRKVDGEFIPCDFPEVEIAEAKSISPRFELVYYVGTGEDGQEHPCSVTTSFPAKILKMMESVNTDTTFFDTIKVDELSTEWNNSVNQFFRNMTTKTSGGYSKKSEDGLTVSWYTIQGAYSQFNELGKTYYILAIG